MHIQLDNRSIAFIGAPVALIRALDRRTAFKQEGHRFHPAFRRGWWDGRVHLIRKLRGQTGFLAPVGLLPDLLEIATEMGVEVEVEDKRRKPTRRIHTDWNPKYEMREYQSEAVDTVVEDRGYLTGKGLLRLPTRSGKTIIAAKIVDRLKVTTLFLVQSEMLLNQAREQLYDALRIEIGQVGSGVWEPKAVTVASVQTLTRRLNGADTRLLFENKDCVIFDECHHLEGNKWRQTLERCDALYKIGLSATIFLNSPEGTPKSTIWLRATTGPILYELEPSYLIRQGYLIQPCVRLIKITEPTVNTDSYGEAYQDGVIYHEVRNARIVAEAKEAVERGLSVLIITRRILHVQLLESMLEAVGLKVGTLTGSSEPELRRQHVASYKTGDISVLLGTVFGEGVDIPCIECVINAEGGKSDKATIQRFRNLTPSPGKERAELVDFMDMTHRLLARHSLARLQMYRSLEAFQLEIIP